MEQFSFRSPKRKYGEPSGDRFQMNRALESVDSVIILRPHIHPMTFPPRLLVFLFLLLTLLPAKVFSQIHADVTVTGAVNGTFTITLEHVKAPIAVANFIGLATGEHGWIDINTGAIRYDGFYNGVSFHRVVKDFVSQIGSRKGDGTDGPGYTFRNEIDATLTHGAYAVAMANSGKHTNGSQFYITDGAQSFLNGDYTVFGKVTAGMAVCDQINNTPVTTGDKPVNAVTIASVTVYGASLAGFNKNPGGLPRIFNAQPVLKKSGASFSLDYEHRTYSEYTHYHSADLQSWTRLGSAYFGSTAPTGELDVTASATGTRHFYRSARTDYSLTSPIELTGNTIHFSNPLGGTAVLNATRTGGAFTFDNNGGSRTIVAATVTAQPYFTILFMQWNDGTQIRVNLAYDTAAGGTYNGVTNVSGFSTIKGTFTVAP